MKSAAACSCDEPDGNAAAVAKGVALIVVHGVADQQPGQTAHALIDLMIAAAPFDETSMLAYRSVGSDELALAVEPLAPRQGPRARTDATPRSEDRSLLKAGLQSVRSDFQRQGWEAAQTIAGLKRGWTTTPPSAGDRGIAATDYLLAKHRDNGAVREPYDTTCIHVERVERGQAAPIAVYEMYWADLSRLSGALPRIVTELFTMVFRLSKLGRDTVDEACRWRRRGPGSDRAWRLTNVLQMTLDWLFANVLALLFAQLFLLALVFVALGLATRVEPRLYVHLAVAGVTGIVAVLLFAYRRRDSVDRPALWSPPVLLALACFGALCLPELRPWLSGLLLLAAITVLYELGLRVADDRFPVVRVVGRTLWATLVAFMLASAVHEVAGAPGLDPEIFDVGWHAALFGVELTLYAIKYCSIGLGALLAVWFLSGCIAAWRPGYESRASLATGRLGLVLSLTTFFVVAMGIWALLSHAIDLSARNVAYSPCLFAFDEAAVQARENARVANKEETAAKATPPPPAPPYAPTENRCLWRTAAALPAAISPVSPSASSAGRFLADRYRGSTAAFSLLAALLLALVAFVAAMFTPSVLAEMKLLVGRGRDLARKTVERRQRQSEEQADAASVETGAVRRLGRWLTAGYRRLDVVVLAVTLLGVVVGAVVAASFANGSWAARAEWLQDRTVDWSQALLTPLVLTSAGIVATLTVLGGLLSKYVPALRGPLDIALDVDNHFREFPRAAIPRARIFSRYAALLRHVAAEGHERIVVVAHSQGTVITAELLRYLASRNGKPPEEHDLPRLDGEDLPPISLLTLGCPLRQLYAARFPTLYRWVIERRAKVSGPRARDIGVSRWVNAFCSGDYVGRWLWSDSPDPDDPVGHPMVDTGPAGRTFVYDGFTPDMPQVAPFHTTTELEVCLGFGAHTHYFELDQTKVARLVDSLVA